MDSLYSALVIEAGDPGSGLQPWELFTYGIGQSLPQKADTARRTHTNVPRTGHAGLPMGWEMRISRWRATTNLRTNHKSDAQLVIDADTKTIIRDAFLLGEDDKAVAIMRELDGALLEPQIVCDWAADVAVSFSCAGRHEVTTTLLDLLQQPHPFEFWLRENLNFEVRLEASRSQSYHRLLGWLGDTGSSMHPKQPQERMTLWIWLEGNLTRQRYG